MTPTQRDYEKLAEAAELVAAQAPAKRHRDSHNAMVPWDAIVELRYTLDGLAIDWRTRLKEIRQAEATREGATNG